MAGVSWTLAAAAIGVPVAFAANLVLSRTLGPNGFGQLAYYALVLAVVTQLVHAGVGSAAIQWGAEYASRGQFTEVRRILGSSAGWHIIVQAPVTIIAALWLLHGSSLALKIAAASALAVPSILGGAALTLTVLNRTHHAAQVALPSAIAVSAASVIAAETSHRADVVWVVALCASGLFIFANLIVLGRQDRRLGLSIRLPRGMPDGFWRYSASAGATSVLALVVSNRSEILLLKVAASRTDVGVFALAYGVAAVLTAPVDTLLGPLAPAAAGLFASHPQTLDRALHRAIRFTALGAGAVLAALVAPLSALFHLLYGPAFHRAGVAFVPLAIMSCIVSGLAPLSAFAAATRSPQTVLRANVIALIVDVILSLAFIPLIGLAGAVIANCGTSLVLVAVVAVSSRHRLSVRQLAETALPIVIGCLALGLALLVGLLRTSPLVRALLEACVGASAYWLLARALKLLLTDAEYAVLSAGVPSAVRPLLHRLELLLRRGAPS
jgi:O-antigen/teichoic acid export membrane protein